MQTIKGINDQIRKNQAAIDAENRAAQTERDKANAYRREGDMTQSQAHTDVAMQHEQRSLQLQNDIADLMDQQQQLQAQLTSLDQQKNQVVASRENELASIDTQIEKLRGGM
jgi:predicted  nucleic acid-binding Zn-ribbon protein